MATGRNGRHSARAILVRAAGPVAVATALFLLFLAFRGPGGHHAAAPAGSGAARPSATPPPADPGDPGMAPVTATATPPAWHADPLGTATAASVAQRAGTVLAAVYDVQTGQTWRLGQDRPQAEASVVKLDILETLLARRSSGLPAASRPLARQMIEDSSNDAATSLWYAAGGATGIQAYNATAGLTGTTPSSCVRCSGFTWPGWGLSTTVPADQITLLKELIGPGPLLTSAERAYALSLLENVTPAQRWGVCGGVPAGVTIALKNGWLPLNDAATDWQVNSVGWISGDGRDYLMAVLTTGNPAEQYGIDTINRLSAIVWNAMR